MDSRKWVFGHYFESNGLSYIRSGELEIELFQVDPNTVGQFIGKLDKNGKEIFEGCELGYLDDDANYQGGINVYSNQGKVFYDEESTSYLVSNRNNVDMEAVWEDCEIIDSPTQN
jgi:hypothetical protein